MIELGAREQEVLLAEESRGDRPQQEVAESLGISWSSYRSALLRARKKLALRGSGTQEGATPEGFSVKGVSTLYGPDGELKAQWVKTDRDAEDRLEALREAVEGIVEPIRGAYEPQDFDPRGSEKDLLAVYPLGDPHIGMHAWAKETGADFDLEIAERNLCTAMDHLVNLAPKTEMALIGNLGDYFHADNPTNRTPASGAPLDVDTRWAKVMRVGIRIKRYLIEKALEKHTFVIVRCAPGNHDPTGAIMLAMALEAWFSEEPRVTVDTSPGHYWYYRHGSVLLGITHGDGAKKDELPSIMATDKPKLWGETEFRHWLTGHIHHDTFKEYRGCTVESFRTLAAKDAWHAKQGYRSGRDMKLDIYHAEYGHDTRHVVGIKRIEELNK